MIVDTLSGSGRYDALHPRFKKAFDYAVARMDTLAPGKYAIDGDDLYIVISEGLLRPEQEAPLEAHDRYIDVQIPLRVRGEERFGWRPRERCILPRGEFDEAADIVFFDDKPSCYVSLHPGEFVVFFPGRRARPADRQRQCPESDPEDPGCVRAGVRYSKRRTIACFFCLR